MCTQDFEKKKARGMQTVMPDMSAEKAASYLMVLLWLLLMLWNFPSHEFS